MLNFKNIFLFFAFSIPFLSFSQNENGGIEIAKMEFQAKQVVPPAPEAAELGKYGNVPISLFTGTPNISIPLFELKGNSFSLPISLSYNASGFKPEDVAPWCGSNWSLNAGGVITRSVQGNPDNTSNYFGLTNLVPPYSDMFAQYAYMQNIQNGTTETQPDIYYFNFAGYSGKFILNRDHTVFKKQKDLNIITPLMNSTDVGIFTIVDENGITYIFDQVETTKMIPFDEEGQPSFNIYNFASSWYLSSMTSANGSQRIDFEYYSYVNEQTLYQNMIANKSVALTYGCYSCTGGTISDLVSSTNIPPTVSMKRKFLKKVTLKMNNIIVAYVDVISATGQRQDSNFPEDRLLNQFNIYSSLNGTDQLVKQYQFTYGYFTNLSNPTYKKRLRLDALQELSVSGNATSPPAYTFTYNTSTAIPERFTADLDHWGYFNAAGNAGLVPSIIFPSTGSGQCLYPQADIGDGANREASYGGSAATILTKIQYPTGGNTTFEYELNEAKFEDNTIHNVGGIRIKQMIDNSLTGKPAIVKNYYYVLDDGTSSGNAGAFPEYQRNSSYHHFPVLVAGQSCADNADYTLHTISVSSNSVYGLGSFMGSPVGYSQVLEFQSDAVTGQPLGKTVYNYNIGSFHDHDEDIANGDLIRQSVFDNAGKLLQEMTSEYQYSTSDSSGEIFFAQTVKGKDLQTNKKQWCRTNTNTYLNYGSWQNPDPSCVEIRLFNTLLYLSNYTIIYQNKRLTKQTQKVFDQLSNNYLTTEKKYTYGNDHLNYPTLIEETTSNGKKIFTSQKYVDDYSDTPLAVPGDIASTIHALKGRNILGLPIEKLQYRQDANDLNRQYINGQVLDYNYTNPTRIYFLEDQPLLGSVTASTITASNTFNMDTHYRLAATYKYGSCQNLIDQSKTSDIPQSYLWDYNQMYAVAEVTGATSDEIRYSSFETDYKGGFRILGSPMWDETSPTGKRCYNLSGFITGLEDFSKPYILSYWRKNNTSSLSVSGCTGNVAVKGSTKNGWTYFEHTITSASDLEISGSGYIDELRLYPACAQMVTYTYEPLIGITSRCDAGNHITYYEYDGLSRLINIKDDNRYYVKEFKYNYGPGTAVTASATSLFYSNAKQQVFTRQGCPSGTSPTNVTYYVPYGKYVAITNQTDADNKALADIAANGQTYANVNGQCLYYNTVQSALYFKDDCPPEQGLGSKVRYTVAAGTYSSLISLADANSKATADVAANGQAYANSNGYCTCGDEGKRIVNGICETGTRINYSYSQEPDGTWKCTYLYTFSDGSTSAYYYSYSASPCPLSN